MLGGNRHLIADHERRHLIVDHDHRRSRENLDVRNGAQGIEDDTRRCLRSKQQIEAGKHAAKHLRGGAGYGTGRAGRAGRAGRGERVDRVDERERPFVARHADIAALDEILDPVAQIVVERDLGDGCVNGHLQLRPIELRDGLLDQLVVLLVGVDHE